MLIATRKEDMSPNGRLTIIHAWDGDVCIEVAASDYNGEITDIASVEFTIPGVGGGHSPRTHAALIALRWAMQADEEADAGVVTETTRHQLAAALERVTGAGG